MTYAALADDPSLDCVFTDFHIFGDSDRIRRNTVRTLRDLLLVNWIPGSGTLQRKRIWEGVGGYCELLSSDEDWDYWIGAYERGLTAEHIPEPLYRYREHGGSLTAGRWPIEFELAS